MTRNERDEAIKVIKKEYACVDADCDIERNCGKCPYSMPSKEPILKAYKMAISALEQQPCEDAVSREMVIDKVNDALDEWDGGFNKFRATLIEKAIRGLPSVTVRQTSNCSTCEYEEDRDSGECYECVKGIQDWYKPKQTVQQMGEWIPVYQGDEIINYRCSECELGDTNGSINLYGWGYCRRCGAKMVEPQESEDKE